MNNVAKTYIGVDISKNYLDICLYPNGKFLKIANSQVEIKKFIKELANYEVAQIACEATGGYEKLLSSLLCSNNYPLWIVDPRRIKAFIRSTGSKAKTDKIDAKKIAEFAFKNIPDYQATIKAPNQETLKSLVSRKKDLAQFLASEKARLNHPSHELSQKSIKEFIKFFKRGIEKIDKQIQDLINVDSKLKAKSKILESIPGIGKMTISILLSFVPELGILNNKEISALVGLCPYENESGTYRGKKFIRGGRAIPRNSLFMCALTIIRRGYPLKAFYNRLIEKGKPAKIAIVAVMHKLIIFANSLLKKGESWSVNC